LRNPALAPLMQLSREGRPIEVQSAQLASPVTESCKECGRESATLNADLMKNAKVTGDDTNPFLTGAVAGSTLFTLSDKDGRTWSVLRVLSAYDHAKVLSHPYVVTVNNQEATVNITEKRRLRDAAEQTAAGAAEVKIKDINAEVGVTIRPRVGAGKTVNMEVKVTVDEFQTANNRFEREVVTNASVATDEILVLGGLVRDDDTDSEGKTPILGDIPIFKWFFKQKTKTVIKNTLVVFIRPTVVEPQLRGDMGEHTKHYIDIAKQYAKERRLFEGLKDPVTRWFFKTEGTTNEAVDAFVEQHTVRRDIGMTLVDSQDKPDSDVLLADNNLNYNDYGKNVIVIDNDTINSTVTSSSDLLGNAGSSFAKASTVTEAYTFAKATAHKMVDRSENKQISNELREDNNLNKGDQLNSITDVSVTESNIPLEINDTLELAAQAAQEIDNAAGHDKLRSLLQGEENPLVV